MTTTIRALLDAAPALAAVARIQGSAETGIGTIVYDSRQVTPGALFAALPGADADGHWFISGALDRGAVAVLAEREVVDPRAACSMIVPDSRAALAQLALAFYRQPSHELGVIGITGTKGKTTTASLVEAILAEQTTTGLIGTVDLKVGPRRWRNPIHQTTPESLDVQRLLREMVDAGVSWAVLETSSHALATHRVTGCAYDIAVITNVTHEHLEFHGTYENYLAAKASLFDRIAPASLKEGRWPRAAVINGDDPGAATILGRAVGVPEYSYGLAATNAVRAEGLVESDAGLSFAVASPWGRFAVQAPLLGTFNVYNVLAAVTTCLVAGVSPATITDALGRFAGVPGRLQRIDQGQPYLVVVDYAHNPDSLAQVLDLLRGVTAGRVIAVFGSGGERDVAKRPLMGQVCAERAGFGIFTDEDPRGEDSLLILDAIAAGARAVGWREGRDYESIPDRRAAIARAFALAAPGDTVVLAGKGHEHSIIYADHHLPWDEAAEARRALVALGYVAG